MKITRIQALEMFKKEHPEYEVVSTIKLYNYELSKKRKLNKKLILKQIKKYNKLGLSLREIGGKLNISHETVRQFKIKHISFIELPLMSKAESDYYKNL